MPAEDLVINIEDYSAMTFNPDVHDDGEFEGSILFNTSGTQVDKDDGTGYHEYTSDVLPINHADSITITDENKTLKVVFTQSGTDEPIT